MKNLSYSASWPPTRYDYDADEASDDLESSDMLWHEEEQASLRQTLKTVQAQFASERYRREEAEREAELLAGENAALEQQLAGMEGCQARVSELEHEAEELCQFWKSESSSRSSRPDTVHSLLLLGSGFLNLEEDEGEAAAAKSHCVLKHWDSEWLKAMQMSDSPDRIYDHECSCVRRAEVVKDRGISLLNEVDAQYSALQVKYDELLRHCHQEDEQDRLSHKFVQTVTDADDFHQPEYKELFREIFSRIQKTKEDLIENRGRPSASEALPVLQ